MPIKEEVISHSPYYFTREKTWEPSQPKQKKALRAKEIEDLWVTVDGNIYQVDEVSLGRMALAVITAGARYNQLLASDPTITNAQAYATIYQDTAFPWRTSNDQNIIINAEKLIEIMEAGTAVFMQVWFSYT